MTIKSSKGIVVVKDKYLLQLRDNKKNIFFPNFWGLFGGSLNKNETHIIFFMPCWAHVDSLNRICIPHNNIRHNNLDDRTIAFMDWDRCRHNRNLDNSHQYFRNKKINNIHFT